MRHKKIIASCVCAILLACGTAFAQDSASITVTCSIPAIPGLNAPLIQEKTQPAQNIAAQPVVTEEDAKETSSTLDEKEETQMVLAKNDASPNVVETYYSR